MQLVFDERIRDYVFIPLLIFMFLIGIMRRYIQTVMGTGRKPGVKITKMKALEENKSKALMMRSKKIRATRSLLTKDSFAMRKQKMACNDSGLLRTVQSNQTDDPMDKMMQNPMMNPNMMGGMLKNNLFMTIMTPLQYGIISYFFSGFIIGKVPFPLTQKFRGMLQSGVNVVGLDVKYVSSLSLYFLSFMGYSSIYQMIFTGDDDDFSNPMAQMNPMAMNPMMGQNPMNPNSDIKDECKKEADNLSVVQHTFAFENCDGELLKLLKGC